MTPVLDIRPPDACRWDLASLGEVMLRLDPGEGRIRTSRSFSVWEGGGEYNVARALRKGFGLRTTIVTALVRNEIGLLVEDLILQGGVDTSWIQWSPSDGVGRTARNGLNFTERGFGIRPAVGVSDRAHTAVSQMEPGRVDWDRLFGEEGVRWFHCGGICASLSTTTASVVAEAMAAARRHKTVVSYDLNYRPSLWQAIGGPVEAARVNRELVGLADVLFGNEEDFSAALGFGVGGTWLDLAALDPDAYGEMMREVGAAYPNLGLIAATLRRARSATRNDWAATCWSSGETHVSEPRVDLEILDRVGGGDAFVSGMVFALLSGLPVATALEYGTAHGALAMTTPGDTSMASRAEVEVAMLGGHARIIR